MYERNPIYKKLFKVLNQRIAKNIENGETELARKEIDVLERLVKLEKSISEVYKNVDKPPFLQIVANSKSEKELLFKELERRLERIVEANPQTANLK